MSKILIWKKNARELVRVGLGEFKGYDVVDIRVHVRGIDKKLVPTKKGITLDVRHLRRLLKAVRTAYRVVRRRP